VCLEERRLVPGGATVDILERAAGFLVEATRADAREAADGARFAELTWASELLPAGAAAACSAGMLRDFAAALELAAWRLARLTDASGGGPPLRSTGEQLAALGILDVCDAMTADAPEWGVAAPAEALTRAAADFRLLRAVALEDGDALLLFDAALDGIEDCALAAPLGLADLGATTWFAR
jgi:hypothetical protein